MNKKRLIDAEELLVEMSAGCIPIMEKGISGVTGDESTIEDYINNAKTIDAEPVRQGKWIKKIGCAKCSACLNECWADSVMLYAFCPHCGAKMDVEGEYDE